MHHHYILLKMNLILKGKIVRPLSAGLLPPSDAEKDGLIKRENLGMIRGRQRKIQMKWLKNMELKIHQMQVEVVC